VVEFEHDSDGVCVPRQIDEVLELVNVRLYIPFAMEISVRLKPHKRSRCLVLWAERRLELLPKFVP
jgi:hypothetical protein